MIEQRWDDILMDHWFEVLLQIEATHTIMIEDLFFEEFGKINLNDSIDIYEILFLKIIDGIKKLLQISLIRQRRNIETNEKTSKKLNIFNQTEHNILILDINQQTIQEYTQNLNQQMLLLNEAQHIKTHFIEQETMIEREQLIFEHHLQINHTQLEFQSLDMNDQVIELQFRNMLYEL